MVITTKLGHKILIDDEDADLVREYTWTILDGYARSVKTVRHPHSIAMHRLIMGAQKEQIIDHVDRNGLNNCRSNLRFCTRSQNACNSISKCGTSKFKGVSYVKDVGRWVSAISFNKKHYHLGFYRDETEAALAYNKAALELHGEFARLNVI